MRELGHEFVARDLHDDQLVALIARLRASLEDARDAAPRVREFSPEDTPISIPTLDGIGERQVFSDSVVSGATNPMGFAAQLWREGEVACMRVTFGKAFEGAPGRAHGGVVAALLDEVMGLMNVIHGAMAFTGQLDITYHAPTPIGEPVLARAWLARSDDRKRFVEATLYAEDVLVASAKALFIVIDRTTFLEQLLASED
jgi:acyl-coenzyme A thioesterase PaaI-like protein